MNRRHFVLLCALCTGLVSLLPGCGEQVEGYVNVDNGSDELIVVFVDGERKARIGPGRCRQLTLPLGERLFKITQGENTIYEQAHTLDVGDRPYRRPSYVLNPDQTNRYCEVEVVYTDEDTGNQDLEDLITMISNSSDDSPAPNESDETLDPAPQTEKEKRASNRAVVRRYREIARGLIPMGDSAFFQIERSGKLFQPLPTIVYSRQSGDQSRSTLARIPRVLHDYLSDATLVTQPTQEELDRLEVAQDVTISYVPFR